MNPGDLILQSPAEPPAQLFLLHHGVGAGPESMGRVAASLARAFPAALLVSVAGPDPADGGPGRQWYSARRLSESGRIQRVAAVLDHFVAVNRHWQAEAGVGGEATALVGFSQGAILSLEAVKACPGLAGRVLSFGGRFAALPEAALPDTCIHLCHGEADRVVPSGHSIAARDRLAELGSDVTLDLQPGLGHGVDETLIALGVSRLRNYVPRRLWAAATAAGRAH